MYWHSLESRLVSRVTKQRDYELSHSALEVPANELPRIEILSLVRISSKGAVLAFCDLTCRSTLAKCSSDEVVELRIRLVGWSCHPLSSGAFPFLVTFIRLVFVACSTEIFTGIAHELLLL